MSHANYVRLKKREWMGIEPTWPLFRGHTGFEARGPVDATGDNDSTCDDALTVVGRMVGQPDAAAGPIPPTLDAVRDAIAACDELPEHIRAAVLALLEMVEPKDLHCE